MQLVPNNDENKDDILERAPILSQLDFLPQSVESSSSAEIIAIGRESSVSDDDLHNLNVDETCHLVNADQPQCRICLDTGGEDLIAPCHCKGTQKYVHRSCLDNWRSTKEGFAFAHCTECRAMFVLRANVPPDRWWLRLKFQFLVARDHAFIFIIVQLVILVIICPITLCSFTSASNQVWLNFLHYYYDINFIVMIDFSREVFAVCFEQIVAFLGVLVYKFYGEELREMFGYEEHPYGFYAMAVLAIILVGLLYGFFIAIICGQRINERHYHVLAKQELTKEYIVEDREHNKNVPELDPSHVMELRMLGLY